MIKGGCPGATVFDSIQGYLERGYTLLEAIAEVESILRGKLPDTIISLINQKYG